MSNPPIDNDGNGDDLHIDPGDDGLLNTGFDMPSYLDVDLPDTTNDHGIWSPGDDALSQQAFPDFLDFLSERGIDPSIAFGNEDGLILTTGQALELNDEIEMRGTFYASPEDAMQAAIDAGIGGIVGIYYDDENDAFHIGISYKDAAGGEG